MGPYTLVQWIFFFYFYCFFGWCFESAYVSIRKKRFVNRGFVRGPFLPIYGSGAIMMLVVSMPFQDNLVLTFLAGCIGATLLEYVTGVTMEALFKVRYWDYSNQKFNFQGHICLSSTLAWGALTIFLTQFLHKPVERFVLMIPQGILTAITWIITVIFVADFALSFRAALDLRNVLVKMEQAREELERMQRRLDVILALADESRTQRQLEKRQRKEELAEDIEKLFARIREQIPASERLAAKREELFELRSKFRMNIENHEIASFLSDVSKRNMLKGNPTMASKKFKEALEELKQSAEEYRKKKDEK